MRTARTAVSIVGFQQLLHLRSLSCIVQLIARTRERTLKRPLCEKCSFGGVGFVCEILLRSQLSKRLEPNEKNRVFTADNHGFSLSHPAVGRADYPNLPSPK
jgi:hypothetical protein